MSDVAVATAAPKEVRIGDHTLKLSPLGWTEYGEIDTWLENAALEQLSAPAIVALPDEDRQVAQRHIIDRAAKMSYISPPFSDSAAYDLYRKLVGSIEAAGRLLHLSVRRNQPEMTLDDIMEILVDPKTLEQLMGEFDRLNAVPDDGEKKGAQTAAAP